MDSNVTLQKDDVDVAASEKSTALPFHSSSQTYSSKIRLICGLGFFHPLCLQRFSTPKWFLFVIGLFVLVQSMMVSGITNSAITTIEKRYGLRSAESGFVVSSFDIGSLVVVVFISYFGGRSHRSRWVGYGAVGVAIGAVLFTLPQYLSSPYQPPTKIYDQSSEILCLQNRTDNGSNVDCESKESNSIYLAVFVISNFIIGIGSTPIYTLGTTFLYDSAPKEDASVYVSILYAIGSVGPAVGYLLGAFFLTFYVDVGSPFPVDDPRFLGAWWMGYLVCAAFILLFSVFLLMFPKKLKTTEFQPETPTSTSIGTVSFTETEVTEDDAVENPTISFGTNLKELPKSFYALLCNRVFMSVTSAAVLEFSITTAFLTFVPKYLQSQFNVNTVQSSIVTGAVLVPSAGTGILLGGYIVKRLRLSLTGCAQAALLSNLLSLLLFISVFFITCEMGEFAGLNYALSDPVNRSSIYNLSSECNLQCSCQGTPYNPLCYENITYINPCYAGCRNSFTSNMSQTSYDDCTCLSSMNYTASAAVQGECVRDCQSSLIPYLVCLFLITMATVSAHTPSLMVTYRCVNNEDRPFAAGVQFLFIRALAYIPAPIYFGAAIDEACLFWEGTGQCQDSSGSCLIYDVNEFRYIFFGIAFTCKVLSFVSMILAWIFCRKEYSALTQTTKWRRMRRKNQLGTPAQTTAKLTADL